MARTISSTTVGPVVLVAADNPLSITSTGQVTSTGTADGIDGATGTVWTITNSGTVKGATGFGISLAGAGTVSSSGVITGNDGVIVRGGGGVTNTGSIQGVGAIGSGPIVGTGVYITGALGTVTNSGTINGQAYGVALGAGGTVTNTGSIIGGHNGVWIVGAVGTVINSGNIIGTAGDVIAFHNGGSVSNAVGASIIGQGTAGAGIYITGGFGTVTNSGAITGIDYVVDLAAGGSVTNNVGGSLTGHRGINVQGAAGTIRNSGSISGAADFGVGLRAGGQVTNAAGASISGYWGVVGYNSAITITNSGTISGTSHAVTFAGTGSNRLVVGATGVFVGDVVGSTIAGSSNTLELVGGTGALSALLAGAGSVTENAHTWAFKNFTALAVDAGGAWTLNGANTVASIADNGSLTIASSGKLTVTTAVDPASAGLFSLGSNAVLDFAADVGSGVQVAFQGPSGVLELADIVGGVVRQFSATISGLNAGPSAIVPTNAVNIQTTVNSAVLSGNSIIVSNNATTVATLVLNATPAAGTTVVTRADATLGGFDVFLNNIGNLPTVTWSPGTETGVEGGTIALGTITPTGTGLTSVLVSGVPVGATLGDGTHSFVATTGTTSVNVLGWNYAGLSIKPPNDANFSLSVQATDGSGNVSAAANEAVTVNPLAPNLAPLTVSGTAGQAIALNLGITTNALSGDSNSLASVTLGSIPTGATLSNTAGNTLIITSGSITFSASQLAAGVLTGLAITPASAGSFSLTVAATEQDAQGNLSTTANGIEALSVAGNVPKVTWSPGTETGVEGAAIALGTITPTGTGLTSVLISGVPAGATLGDGTHSFVATTGTTSVNVLGWNYAGLSIKPPNDANFSLSVQATDGSGNVSAAANEAVTVNPLAPNLAPLAVSGTAGQAIALNLGITTNALSGDSNSLASVTLGSIPAGATLSNTAGNTLIITSGSITFSASQLAAGVLTGLAITPASAGSFSLTVAATEQDAQGNLSTSANGIEALSVAGNLPTVTWSPGTETGIEGAAIALGTITPTGTGLTSVLISGVAAGATLGDGTHSFVATTGTTSVNVLGWNYAGLSIKPPNDANFSLSVQATDGSGNVSAAANEAVTVNPLAPNLVPLAVSGTAGQAIALNLGITTNALSGDSNSLASVTLGSIPAGATLSNTAGSTLIITSGSITFSASQLAAGVLTGLAITPASAGSFSLTVATTEQDAQGNLSTTANGIEALSVAGNLPKVTWSPGTETGVEGAAIALGTITPTGTGLTSVLVSGVPVGATLSDGTHSFIATAGTTSVNVLGWNYAGLSIKPPNDANFSLSVQATDGSGNVSAAANEAVTVNPLAPNLAPLAVSGTAGQAIALNLGITTNALSGDSNSLASVTLGSIPAGATLSNTAGNTLTVTGGSITFSASQIAAGYLTGLAITPIGSGTFTLSLAATEQDAQSNLSATTNAGETLTVAGTVGVGGTIGTSITGPYTLTAATNPLTITSTGKITSSVNGITGASGTTWTIGNSGTITASTGSASGIRLSGPGIVTNSGMITTTGSAYGVGLDNGGTVTNSGTIIGGEDGVRFISGIGTLINSGSIASTVDDGIGFFNGGSVTNAAGASISNLGTKGAGIYITGGFGTVTNSGAITGIDYAVDLAAGGSVTNNVGVSLTGHRGINVQGAAGTIRNSGSISGAADFGVGLRAGGQVTNAAGASISGYWGVVGYNSAITITNSGTISGTGRAINFSGTGSNRLVAGATGVIIGSVVGSTASGSSNTLELAGGTGTLSGLSAGAGTVTENAHAWSFSAFNALALDTGAVWTAAGKNAVANLLNNGSVTIAASGTLDVSTAIDPASSGLFLLTAGSTLEVAAALGMNTQMSFLGSSSLTIDKFGSFGTNVGSTAYAGPELVGFATGDTVDILGFSPTGDALSYNALTGVLQISNGSSQLASLAFQNANLGTGSFHAATDGGTGIIVTHSLV